MGIFLFLALFFVGAREVPSVIRSNFFTDKIQSTFEEIESLKPESFPKEIPALRARVEKFLSYQKNICQGEFSTIVLNEFGGTDTRQNELKKLDQNERRLCFRELKSIQVTFINSVHKARRNYLDYVHRQEMESLDTLRRESVLSVEKSFSTF